MLAQWKKSKTQAQLKDAIKYHRNQWAHCLREEIPSTAGEEAFFPMGVIKKYAKKKKKSMKSLEPDWLWSKTLYWSYLMERVRMDTIKKATEERFTFMEAVHGTLILTVAGMDDFYVSDAIWADFLKTKPTQVAAAAKRALVSLQYELKFSGWTQELIWLQEEYSILLSLSREVAPARARDYRHVRRTLRKELFKLGLGYLSLPSPGGFVQFEVVE
ncbi:hypothetical protein N7451_012560 [Penicillium sp. IBT 35674x]|nr:hypothetical protein N7451_012560 [Penicillium sp. IBT 35674x]